MADSVAGTRASVVVGPVRKLPLLVGTLPTRVAPEASFSAEVRPRVISTESWGYGPTRSPSIPGRSPSARHIRRNSPSSSATYTSNQTRAMLAKRV